MSSQPKSRVPTRPATSDTRPEAWLDQHGDALFAFAMARVTNRAVAEDLVQDTLLAAISARNQFEQKSTVRTWLLGILRHKVIDHIRRESRARQFDQEMAEAEAANFDRKGIWTSELGRWPADPTDTLEQDEFWEVFEQCRTKLPRLLYEAFALREMEQLSCDEVCKILAITSTNLSVRLHRARLALRKCLEQNWFSSNR